MATLIHPWPAATGTTSVAAAVEPLVDALFGGQTPVSFEFWDGSHIDGGAAGTMRLNSPDALRHIIWSPDELGVSRAYVTGEIDTIGDTAEILRALQPAQRLDTSATAAGCRSRDSCRAGPRWRRHEATRTRRGAGAARCPSLARP